MAESSSAASLVQMDPEMKADLSAWLAFQLGSLAHHERPKEAIEKSKEKVRLPSNSPYSDWCEEMTKNAREASKRASDLYRMAMAVKGSKYEDGGYALHERHREAKEDADLYVRQLSYIYKLADEDPDGLLRNVLAGVRHPEGTSELLFDLARNNNIKVAVDHIKQIKKDKELQVHVSQHKIVYLRDKVRVEELKDQLAYGVIRAEAANERVYEMAMPFVHDIAEHIWAAINEHEAGEDQDGAME